MGCYPVLLLLLQTCGDGIIRAEGIIGQPVLIVDLDVLNIRELLEIEGQQIGNCVIWIGGFARAG